VKKKQMSEADRMKVVECGCGMVMRQKDWADHWRTCWSGCGVIVTEDDVRALEAYEERRRVADAEHQAWMNTRKATV
jgi:hypothetical protein